MADRAPSAPSGSSPDAPANTRTHSPAWWMGELAIACVLCLIGALVLGMIGVLNTGTSGLLAGLTLALLPAPLYVLVALWVDRYEKEPLSMLGLAFLWGGTGAVFLSLIANSFNTALFAALAGEAVADVASAVVSAPLVEESAKGAALFLLYFWKRHEFDNVIDGILYASMVGLGFATMENVSYYGEAAVRGETAQTTTLLVRGVLTPFAHPFFTAMTGIGLGIAREATHPLVKLSAPVLGLGTAMFIHSVWNFAAGFGWAFFWTYFLVMVPAFAGLVALVVFAQRRERRIIHAHLLRYAHRGAFSRSEVDTLCRWGGRTRTLWVAWRAEGLRGWRRENRFHQVASELAFHSWRLHRGISRSTRRDDAFEAEHLRELRELRPRPGSLERETDRQRSRALPA